MALTQSTSVDILFKKVVAAKSDTDSLREYFEEPINSRPSIVTDDIWLQSNQIPLTAAPVPGVVTLVTASLTYVSGSKGSFVDGSNNLRDIIPFNYGDGVSYKYRIYRNNSITEIPLGESDWFFDQSSGVLTFFSLANAGTVQNLGGDTIASPSAPPVVVGWKYTGLKGIIPNLAGLTYSGGTLSSPIASLSAGYGLSYSSYSYSILLASMSSGLTFASDGGLKTVLSIVTAEGLTFSNEGTLSVALGLGNPGLTFSSEGRISVLNSLVLTDTDATLGTNVLGKYTTDPVTNISFDSLSIPTKGYVDSIASGLSLKQSVRVAATGSVDLQSAPAKIDGVTLSFGDRVLLWQQDGTVNGTISNGIYAFSASGEPLRRTSDLDGVPSSEVTPGVYTFVTDGETYIGTGFVVVNIGTESQIQVGTQSMRWTQFSSAGTYIFGDGVNLDTQTVNLDLEPDKGLTFSSSQLTLRLSNNSGLKVDGGLQVDPYIANFGLTFNNGKIDVYKPIEIGRGLTFATNGNNYEGFTYSVRLADNNGLTYSLNGDIMLDPNLFGTYSALTFSNNQLYMLTEWGVTVSNGQVRSSWTAGDGFDIIQIAGGLTYSHKLQPVLNSTTGLYFDYGFTPSQISINWPNILGQGLTWSANKVSTLSAGVNKFATTLSFTAGIAQYVTHSLNTTDFVIQMYNDITGDEILAQYTGRTINDIYVTAYEDVSARIVIIG
jgi:hypothetical protein